MKHSIYLLIVLILITSCSNDDDDLKNTSFTTCSVEEPIKDLDWLKSEINKFEDNGESSKYNYIVQTNHNNKTVFIFANCNPFIDSVFLVKNCGGDDITFVGNEEENVSFESLYDGLVIWKSSKSECNL